ncbi:unnamed protein product [Schistosoma rodhaini]|uniref:PDZ domain-containing protein n=2 Tax=Schistosoma rodhaini TaxID=6188 RepID=A0AA85F4Y7_9TREM|nr:unnamed protein product [Schistosoma rodhaini]
MSKHYTTNDIISEKAISMGETNQGDIQGNGNVCPITTYTIHSNICPDKLLNTSPVYSVTKVIHELNPNSSVPSSKTVVKTSFSSNVTSNGKINLSTISNYNTNSATNVTIPSCTKQSGNIISTNVGNSKNIDQSAYIILSQNNCIPFYTLQKNSFYKPAYRPQLSLSCQPSPNISYNRTFSNDINNDLVNQSRGNGLQNSINVTENLKYPSENVDSSSLSLKHRPKDSFQSLDESSSFKLKSHQFFHRFLKYSSKFGGITKSENNSPSLLSSSTPPIHRNPQPLKNAYASRYCAWNPMISSSSVKLIDTCLIKKPSGFGLTLSGVITFIPNGILDVNIISNLSDKQKGFFQRLLQIRSVSDDVITYDNDLVQSLGKNNSIRPGDILLAAGGCRLAGCTPEYAVQLLAKVPVGSAVQVTLLRGLGIPGIYSVTEDHNYTKHFNEPRSFSSCSSMSSSSELSPKRINSDFESQNGSKCVRSYMEHFCSNCCNSLRTVKLVKKENEYGFTYFYTNYGCLVNQVTRNNINQLNKTKLQPGDLIVKIGHFDVVKLTNTQFSQLLSVYLKSESIQFTVIHVCSTCLKQVNHANIHSNSKKSKNHYLDLNKTTSTPTTPTIRETNKAEMISFLRTVLNANCHGKKSTNHNLQTNDKHSSSNTSELNNVNNLLMKRKPESWLPVQCITPGIGKSGPCETPDFVPISQFINTLKTNNHQINDSSHLNNIPQYDYQKFDVFKQNQINEQQQQSIVNDKHCDNPLLDQISSPYLSPIIQMKNSHNPMLNIPEINTSNTNYNNFTEDVKIRYSTKDGKLKFVKENIEQNLSCIIPVEDNGNSSESSQNLVVGDLLVAIENHSVLSCKPNEIEELLRSAAKNNNGFVTLTVRRIHPSDKAECMKISEVPTKDSNSSNIINVELLKEKDEGFGFVIVSSLNKEKASEIGRIIPGSPADKCGQLKVGQRILAINGYCLFGINHMDIVNLIRQSQQQLILTIEKTGSLSNEQHNSRINSLDTDENFIPPATSTMACSNASVCFHPTNGSKTSESSLNNISTRSLYSITLQRGPNGFGFSVRSGFDSNTSPLIVYRIAENGPAFQEGQMKVGDEILEINGISTLTMTHQQAVTLIRLSGSTLRIILQRFNENQNEYSF